MRETLRGAGRSAHGRNSREWQHGGCRRSGVRSSGPPAAAGLTRNGPAAAGLRPAPAAGGLRAGTAATLPAAAGAQLGRPAAAGCSDRQLRWRAEAGSSRGCGGRAASCRWCVRQRRLRRWRWGYHLPLARSSVEETSARNSEAGISSNRPCGEGGGSGSRAAGVGEGQRECDVGHEQGRASGRASPRAPCAQASAPAGTQQPCAPARLAPGQPQQSGAERRTVGGSTAGISTSASVLNCPLASSTRPATRKEQPRKRSLAN